MPLHPDGVALAMKLTASGAVPAEGEALALQVREHDCCETVTVPYELHTVLLRDAVMVQL